MRQNSPLPELEEILLELTRTPLGRRAFLASVPMLMAACSTTGKSRYREGDNTGQETALTVDDEKRMTAEYLPQMRKDFPAVNDAEIQRYVTQIGTRLVSTNNLSGQPYHYTFTVVDSTQVNAFALPAGTIFVTAPLIHLAESEAELAGVIGHEIGHVKARHTAERLDQAEKDRENTKWYAVGGGLIGAAAGFGVGKLLCPPSDKACVAKAATLGAAAGVGGGLLIQKYKFLANSQENEMEADRIGFRVAHRAGYSSEHIGAFYNRLQKMDASRKNGTPLLASLSDALSTHPPSIERVSQMREMAKQSPSASKAIVSSTTFDKTKKRVDVFIQNKARKI